MDINQASNFLAGSILTGLGFIVVFITILVINNLLHKYWKPVKWIRFEDYPTHFISEEEAKQVDIQTKQN